MLESVIKEEKFPTKKCKQREEEIRRVWLKRKARLDKIRPKEKKKIKKRLKRESVAVEMKVTWKNHNNKKKRCLPTLSHFTDLPFEHHQQEEQQRNKDSEDENGEAVRGPNPDQSHATQLANEFQTQGDKLAMDGKYREALGKWEAALVLAPDVPVLHEQKAQVLLEIGDAWNALKAATRATELEPSWAEAWVTLGRAQLNFGEPDNAIDSFDRALALKPDYEEAQDDRRTALHLVKKRKQLHSSGRSATQNRYVVGDKDENS